MSLSAADLAAAERQVAEMEAAGLQLDAMPELTTVPMVIGFLYREAIQDGADHDHALDLVEVLIRSIPMAPHEVREIASVLGRIGFVSLAARLRTIAGRRLRDLVPLL